MASSHTVLRSLKWLSLVVSSCLLLAAPQATADNWDDTFNTAVGKLNKLKVAGANGDIWVILERLDKGQYKLAGLGSKALPMPMAEKSVRAIVTDALKSIPAHPRNYRYIYFAVSFQNGLETGISGPYYKNAFAYKNDNDMLLATGLKKKNYEDHLEDKLKATDLKTFAGFTANQLFKTHTQMRLSADGHIIRLNVIAPDDTARQTVYRLLGSKQPFGKMPVHYLNKPDFLVEWCWQKEDAGASSPGFQKVSVRHLDY